MTKNTAITFLRSFYGLTNVRYSGKTHSFYYELPKDIGGKEPHFMKVCTPYVEMMRTIEIVGLCVASGPKITYSVAGLLTHYHLKSKHTT